MLEVRLLGPPQVLRDGVPVAFDTRKATALLAFLALSEAPRPRDTLADLLWPEADLTRARGALRRTLSALRSVVGAERVEANRDHVRLVRDEEVEVDVDRFRRLRSAGDLEGAVALFGGRFLEGFVVRDAPEFEEWADTEGESLQRELTTALRDLAAAREAAGDLTGALDLVERWLAVDPLHEPAHQSAIRLLAASGERAAALTRYRDCVRVLSHELGVPPLRETTELYEAINRGTFEMPAAPAPPAPAAAPPPGEPAFVGRDAELAALVETHARIADDGRVALVEGEPGVGRTRLAEQLADTLKRAGAVVVAGHGYDDEAGLAYGPVVEMLRSRLHTDTAWVATLDDLTLAEAARLVPELTAGRRVPEPAPLDGPGAESRFLASVWDALCAAVAGNGSAAGVLLLDDAQSADEATLRLLSYGLRRLAGRAVLVVLVWATPAGHPLRHAATAAARDGGVVVELGRLDEDSVAEVAESVLGPVEPDVVRRLWQTTEGVPRLLVEYLRAEGDTSEELPAGVRGVLESRLAPVSETGRQILAAAAVVGSSFDAETLRSVSGRSDEETVTALEEVVGRGLVRERAADYVFDHELVRALVAEETSLARRRLLHGRAADVPGAPRAVAARHLELAGRDAEAAAAYLEAAEQARSLFANDEALAHLRSALALGRVDKTMVLTAIADLQARRGDYAGALTSLETAAAEAGPADLATVEHALGRLQHRRGEYVLAESHLRAALEAVPASDVPTKAALAVDLSLAVHAAGDQARASELAVEALSLAERSGDPRATAQALNLMGVVATADGDLDAALEHLGRCRALADQLGDPDLQVAALNNLALAHRAAGDLPSALDLTAQALDLCAAIGDRHREAALHNNLADVLHQSGRAEEAMTHLKSAVEIFAEVGVEEEPRPEIWKLVHW